MRRFFLILFLSAFLVTGCKGNQQANSSVNFSTSISNDPLIVYEYEELEEKLISWDDIYQIELSHFYVYFFSRTCGHCQRIKNLVIPILLRRKIYYACEMSKEHNICSTPKLGHLKEVDLCIIGYPTIIEIKNGAFVKYASGENEVLSFLNSK